jgi:IS1 family transposase/transposase-like protein
MNCPYCLHEHIVKNGSNGVGTQKFRCNNCSRQFVDDPKNTKISDETKELIDKLLLEKIPLAGIARVLGISERGLQTYVNNKYKNVSRILKVYIKTTLTLECDEAWSFVGKSNNKQWIWLALDRDSREVIGYYIGDRSANGAKGLWDSLPNRYRENAKCYTDFWGAYQSIFPEEQHFPVGKETGKTNPIERFNCTLRQRVSRLVRKTLSYSKKIENHIGAILYFIHHYNSEIRKELLAL